MHRLSPARRLILVLFVASLSLAQTDTFAGPAWGKTGDKPPKEDSDSDKGNTGKGKPNKPPTIEGTPSTTAAVDVYYSFQPGADDRDGDPLTFSISNRPSWAAFDTAKGFLSGYPDEVDAGSITNNIVISVSDGKNTVSLSPFSLSVEGAPANSPPVISGSPAGEVIATETYSFIPAASDPDGDSLQFSVTNLPGWAAFNVTSGRLQGTPGHADVGVYENIRVSVSDGLDSASTDRFSIAVVDTTNGSTTLSWAAPTRNVDGSALTDLTGFRIYYGSSSGQYDQLLEIGDPGIMTAMIDNLTRGSWYFAATALSSRGLESELSAEVEKMIE